MTDLELRVAKLEEQVKHLLKKANPPIALRCKDYLRKAGGNYPTAIAIASSTGDRKAAKRLENQMNRMD